MGLEGYGSSGVRYVCRMVAVRIEGYGSSYASWKCQRLEGYGSSNALQKCRMVTVRLQGYGSFQAVSFLCTFIVLNSYCKTRWLR